MKKVISISVMVFLTLALFNVNAIEPQKKTTPTVANTTTVEVYYFHYSRRCATCQAVENESQKAISSLYPSQYKSGKIIFKSINLDEAGSKALAEKCKADGQVLLVISENKRFDITEKGFMYARSSPEKLKKEYKKIIDPLIK